MSTKKQKFKNRLKVIIPLVIICLFLFIYKIGYYTYRIGYLNYTKNELEEKLEQLKIDENNLKNEIVKLQDEEYLEKYAREKYKYSKNDEIIISINETKKDEVKNNNDLNKYTKISIISGAILIGIFIIILNKKDRKDEIC